MTAHPSLLSRFIRVSAIVFLLALTSCSAPDRNRPDVFVSEERIERLKEGVAKKQEPFYSAYESLVALADENLDRVPTVPGEWHVPGYYHDAEGHNTAKNGLRDDANIAYAHALCFRISGRKDYARAAIRLIDGWVQGIETMSTKADSTLSFSYHFPAMIFAADLLRTENVWPQEDQDAFERFLRERALPMNTMQGTNNWGNWGLVLASACAAYLSDQILLDACVDRWKFFIEHQIAEDGHLPHEVNRNEGRHGIWYSHFCLMPQTIAAEIIRLNGPDLFDYVSPSGRSLRQAYDRLIPWVESPETFPYWEGDPDDLVAVGYFSYFEILNAHWPNPVATRLLASARPVRANHSAPYLTLTHGVGANE